MTILLAMVAQLTAPAPAAEPPPAPVAPPEPIILTIAIDRELSSHDVQIDDVFPIKLEEALIIDNRVILPLGLRGEGQVVHVSRAKGLGKGGELIVAARYLQCGTTRLPLRGFRLDGTGSDKTGTLVAATAVVGVIAAPLMFMKGGESIIPLRSVGHAKLVGPLPVTPDGAIPCADTSPLAVPANASQQGVTQ